MNGAWSLNHEFDVIGTVFTFDILTVPGICFDKILGPTPKHLEDSGVRLSLHVDTNKRLQQGGELRVPKLILGFAGRKVPLLFDGATQDHTLWNLSDVTTLCTHSRPEEHIHIGFMGYGT
jgi:hypothetical protein